MRVLVMLLLIFSQSFLLVASAESDNSKPITTSLPLAPSIPLEPQFPLELSQQNREMWIDNPARLEESKHFIHDFLTQHSFPWFSLMILLAFGGIGWNIYLVWDRLPKWSFSKKTALSPLQKLDRDLEQFQKRIRKDEKSALDCGILSSLLLEALQLKLGDTTKGMTSTELAREIIKSKILSDKQRDEILSVLSEIDLIKFAGKQYSQEDVSRLFNQLQDFHQYRT